MPPVKLSRNDKAVAAAGAAFKDAYRSFVRGVNHIKTMDNPQSDLLGLHGDFINRVLSERDKAVGSVPLAFKVRIEDEARRYLDAAEAIWTKEHFEGCAGRQAHGGLPWW